MINKKLLYGLFISSFIFIFFSLYLMLYKAPTEISMGEIQKIFYFHVASAIISYFQFFLVFTSSLIYLNNKNIFVDFFARASAEVGFLLSTIVLVTGVIWAKPIWNVWFNWEPRLVSFLLIWLIFLVYHIIRFFTVAHQARIQSAILGIIACLLIPIMIFSIKVLPLFQQLHPVVIENAGLTKQMSLILLLTTFSMLIFSILLTYFKYCIYKLNWIAKYD